MKDQNCAYCMEGELVAAFGIKICDLDTQMCFCSRSRVIREELSWHIKSM